MIGEAQEPPAGLQQNWSFSPSRRSFSLFLERRHLATRFRIRAPRFELIRAPFEHERWVVYFLYLPDGTLTPSHRFTLRRLSDLRVPLFTVVGAHDAGMLPAEVATFSSALAWKALEGYDFSAYSFALRVLAKFSAGCTTLILNDSVFGPFADPFAALRHLDMGLVGFTASSQVENHLQSYAFVLSEVDQSRVGLLGSVFPETYAYSTERAVVYSQETIFARVAARSMSVGSLFFADAESIIDPSLVVPFQLLEMGHPWLKRSLLGKHASRVLRERVLETLHAMGHPVDSV